MEADLGIIVIMYLENSSVCATLVNPDIVDGVLLGKGGVVHAHSAAPRAPDRVVHDDVEVGVEGPRLKGAVALRVAEVVDAVQVALDVRGRPVDAVDVELVVGVGDGRWLADLGAHHVVELAAVDCGHYIVRIVADVFHDVLKGQKRGQKGLRIRIGEEMDTHPRATEEIKNRKNYHNF